MQHESADELHVEVTHLERAPAGFAHDGERLRDQPVDRFPRPQARPQGLGDTSEAGVIELAHRLFELVYGNDGSAITAQQTLVSRSHHPLQDVRHHVLSSS